MPEFKEVEDFPRPEDDLQELTLFHWETCYSLRWPLSVLLKIFQ
jgi:hypothetical protein